MSIDKYIRLKGGYGKRLMRSGKAFQYYHMIKMGASNRKAWDMIGEEFDLDLGIIMYDYYAREEQRRRTFDRPDKHIPNAMDGIVVNEMELGGESFKDLWLPAIEDKVLINKKSRC